MLLILAGVSISLILDNNGIIQRSRDAKERYGQARENEQVDLNNASAWIDEVTDNINWEEILKKLEEDPESYKHPDQEDTNPDIGVGTDGKPVNLDLWHYRITNNGKDIALNEMNGSNFITVPGYSNENITEEGTIIGKMPHYIYVYEMNRIYPIKNADGAFYQCKDLVIAPELPNITTSLELTFAGCSSLTTIPEIPSSVINMRQTFSSCASLTVVPRIPENVTDMWDTFARCTSLTTAPEIPSSVTDMGSTFSGCTSLITAPEIPSNVTDMGNTFYGCTSLTTAPEIPSSVTNMRGAFYNCSNLEKAPSVISNNVKYLGGDIYSHGAFEGCTKLTGSIIINANPSVYTNCFRYASTASGTNLVVSGSSNVLDEIIATKSSNSNITKGN